MKTKNIAGVNINMDNIDDISYEQIMKSALNSIKYYRKPGAIELIDKELRSNGFEPVKPKSKVNKSKSDRKPIQKGVTKE